MKKRISTLLVCCLVLAAAPAYALDCEEYDGTIITDYGSNLPWHLSGGILTIEPGFINWEAADGLWRNVDIGTIWIPQGHYLLTSGQLTDSFDGLPVGTYWATITVYGEYIDPASLVVSFTVNAPAKPQTEHEHEDEIHLAYMQGYPQGDFRPEAYITRAEIAAILTRLSGQHIVGAGEFDAFVDVSSDHWHHNYVAWAFSAGYVFGDPASEDGQRKFRPDDPITRQEFAAIAARTPRMHRFGGGTMQFGDWSQIHDWAKTYVLAAFRAGWVIGDEEGMFRPLEYISRAEVATVFNRLLGRVDGWEAFGHVYLVNPNDIRSFPDVPEAAWYYPSVASATNDHRLRWCWESRFERMEIVP